MSRGEWRKGDVVSITDTAHLFAVCIFTSSSAGNESCAWLLVDEECASWRSTEWVENRAPVLLVHKGSGAHAESAA